MKRSRTHDVTLIILSLLVLMLLIYPAARTSAQSSGVQAAWERAQQAGAYDFGADITQTTLPLPTVTNIGRTSLQDKMRLEGETNLPERTMHLRLWSQGGSVLQAESSAELRVEGERAFMRKGAEEWEEVENFTSGFAPQGDLTAFLSAARDVVEQGVETRAGVTFTRYTFRVDGKGFAIYLRDQFQKRLAEAGTLPAGVSLDVPRQYVDMTGHGELWVGVDGLPLRQIIHLEFPPRPDDHRITSDITVDYSNFRTAARSSSGVLGRIPFIPTSSKALQQFALFMSMASFAALLVVQRRSKKLYGALALSLIVMMVTTPLLQSVQAAAFIERWTAKTTTDSEQQASSVANR
ncbi:MAG: hypothetical protein PVF45_10205, partial [Anaerolineae bacterium]